MIFSFLAIFRRVLQDPVPSRTPISRNCVFTSGKGNITLGSYGARLTERQDLTLQTPKENQVTNQGVRGRMMKLLLMFLVGEQQEEKHIVTLQNLEDQHMFSTALLTSPENQSSMDLQLNLGNNVYVYSTDKYTSGFYNAPRWRKRNPCENTYSKFKTTIQ
ncbi:hypothetical protein Q9233_003828, partial [Columba guinea]